MRFKKNKEEERNDETLGKNLSRFSRIRSKEKSKSEVKKTEETKIKNPQDVKRSQESSTTEKVKGGGNHQSLWRFYRRYAVGESRR